MSEPPRIIRYVVWLIEHVEGARDPSSGFRASTTWLASANPIPVPAVGDEFDFGTEAQSSAMAARPGRVVKGVRHYIQRTSEGLIHNITLRL